MQENRFVDKQIKLIFSSTPLFHAALWFNNSFKFSNSKIPKIKII